MKTGFATGCSSGTLAHRMTSPRARSSHLAKALALSSLLFLSMHGIAQPENDAAKRTASAIIDKAMSASEPATLLDDGVDLSDAALIDALLLGLDQLRKKHGGQKTLAFSARLLAAARATGDEPLLARTLTRHASTLERASSLDAAIQHWEGAASIYNRIGRPGDAAVAYNDIGSVLQDQGKLAAAGELFRKSREHGWEHWGPKQRITLLLREGTLARTLGRPHDAIRINEEALAIARSSGDKENEARLLNNLALIHQNLAEYRKAAEFGKASLALRPPGDHQARAISLTNLGNIYESQGDKEEAFRTYRAAADEAEKTGDPKGLAITRVNLGIQLRKMGRPQEARVYLEQGLRLAGEIGFARLRIGARREFGLVLIALGEKDAGLTLLNEALAEAEKLGSAVDLAETQLAIALHTPHDRKAAAERALKFARDAKQPEFEWAALTLLGDIEASADAKARAIEHYTAAVAVIERIRRHVAGGDVQRQTFFEDKLRPYHALVELHFAAGDLREAFAWIQQAKARVLLDSLALERRQITTAPAPQTERLDELRQKVAEADAAKQRANAERARAELDAAAQQVAAPAVLAPVSDVDQLARKLLNAETGLLEFLVLPERTLLAVLTAENGAPSLQIHAIDLPAAELRRAVEELRAALATRQLGYEKVARRLWTLLLGPAESQLTKLRRIVVAPSGSLWHLPFQVLRDEENRFLIDRLAVLYAPSASSLLQMKVAAGAREKKNKTLLMSNPARPDSGKAFPDLQGAARLAAELPPVYGKDDTVVLTGEAASEHALKRRTGEFDTLHYAVHGVFDPATPLQSHLRLAPGEGEDGLLEAREIMELRLDASLAVLAACESGRGGEDAGEGIIGMTWAFFLAHCPTVVASQWKVDSASLSELSLGLHKQLAGGTSAAAALQRAATELRKNRAYRHPFYWAPFIVVGADL